MVVVVHCHLIGREINQIFHILPNDVSGSSIVFVEYTEYVAFSLVQPFEKSVGEGLDLAVFGLCTSIDTEFVFLLFDAPLYHILPLFDDEVAHDVSVLFVELFHFVVPLFQ